MEHPEILTADHQQIYNALLNTKDWETIAEKSGYSWSTVNNVINGRTKVNGKNQVIITQANELCRERVQELKNLITRAETEILNN